MTYEKSLRYELKSESTPTNGTFRREFDLAGIIYPPQTYKELRSFYGKFETKDQENVVLKVVSDAPDKSKTSGN
jgi:hypothetical protein